MQGMTVKVVCDRGVTHEIVRHRLFMSYAQESTRYCNYGSGVQFILPPWVNIPTSAHEVYHLNDLPIGLYAIEDLTWFRLMAQAEAGYLSLLQGGWRPEQARDVLPNSLKTEIVITAPLCGPERLRGTDMDYGWRHVFDQRCAPAAHPQMREVMIPLREAARELFPGVF